MSIPPGVEEAVERLWPGRVARLELLGGGITNHNVKIELDDGTACVLRVAGQDTGLLGIDRRAEREATRAAAALGVGPEVLGFLEPEGWLVTRFIGGAVPPVDSLRSAEGLEAVARLLRVVHSGPPVPASFDSFRVVEAYRDTAAAHGSTRSPGPEAVWATARRIESVLPPVEPKPCHNDLLQSNFIEDGSMLRLVDWEYAGMGDVFFDLANFAVNQELDEERRRALLEAYFGDVPEGAHEHLELMRFMSDFREAMWGVLQAAISRLEFDYDAYAAEHFERLERIAAEPPFRKALGA